MSDKVNTITLTHEQKVELLRAVERGEIDTSIFGKSFPVASDMTREELEAELCRLEAAEDRQYLANVAEAMKLFAAGTISLADYTAMRVDNVRKHSDLCK